MRKKLLKRLLLFAAPIVWRKIQARRSGGHHGGHHGGHGWPHAKGHGGWHGKKSRGWMDWL